MAKRAAAVKSATAGTKKAAKGSKKDVGTVTSAVLSQYSSPEQVTYWLKEHRDILLQDADTADLCDVAARNNLGSSDKAAISTYIRERLVIPRTNASTRPGCISAAEKHSTVLKCCRVLQTPCGGISRLFDRIVGGDLSRGGGLSDDRLDAERELQLAISIAEEQQRNRDEVIHPQTLRKTKRGESLEDFIQVAPDFSQVVILGQAYSCSGDMGRWLTMLVEADGIPVVANALRTRFPGYFDKKPQTGKLIERANPALASVLREILEISRQGTRIVKEKLVRTCVQI